MKPRPKLNDDIIIEETARKLAVKVAEWLNNGTESDAEFLINDIKKAIKYSFDGYKIAKELDNYEPDAALVEILDKTCFLMHRALKSACEKWNIENDLFNDNSIKSKINNAIEAIEAIEEELAKPVMPDDKISLHNKIMNIKCNDESSNSLLSISFRAGHNEAIEAAAELALQAELAKPEPEPIGKKPLTDDEISYVHSTLPCTYNYLEFARAIEKAHGII